MEKKSKYLAQMVLPVCSMLLFVSIGSCRTHHRSLPVFSVTDEKALWEAWEQDPHFREHGNPTPRAEQDFKRGLHEIMGKMTNREPVVLTVGGGDVRRDDLNGPDPEFGLPTQWGWTDERGLRDESRVGEYRALRWYASRGFYPVNSKKIREF